MLKLTLYSQPYSLAIKGQLFLLALSMIPSHANNVVARFNERVKTVPIGMDLTTDPYILRGFILDAYSHRRKLISVRLLRM